MRKKKRRGRGVVARGIVLAAMLWAGGLCALALDPALDVSQYAHNAWKVREGFFKDSISSIAQTPDGYLWLGTQVGLLRFDGVKYVLWQPPANQQLPSNHIRSLFAARDGRLWIGTQLGLASWKDGKLTLHPEIAGQVGRAFEDHEGTVWVGTRYPPPGKLCAFRRDGVRCYGEGREFGDRASSLYEDRAGNLWVGAQTGLWRWKPGPPKFYPLADFESSQGLVAGDNGALLIAERKELKQLIDEKVVAYRLPADGLRFQPARLLRDRDGGLWIGSFDRGLVHLHQGRVDLFSQADGLTGNYIRDLFEDREGNIWVATENGLDRFRQIAVPAIAVNQGLSQTTPWSVLAASDGSVWVGTLDGLNRLQDGQITIYRKRRVLTRRGAAAVREVTASGLPDDLIQSLFEDARRRIWISTRGGLVYFENDRFIPVSGISGGVHAIAGDAAGNIWISADQRLFHWRGGRVVEQFPWASLGRKVPAIPMIADPGRGGLWLGFRDGTGLAYFKDGQLRASYTAAEGLGRGLVGNLQLDADGTLWAATEGGLNRLKDGKVATLTAKNGLPCDGVLWVIEGDDQAFWLYTACGLARVARSEVEAWAAAVEQDKDTKQRVQATVFDNSDGVRIHAAPGGFTPQVGKSPDGRIWLLPWDGVSVIDPRRLPFNPLPPPVHIEQITANGQTYDAVPGLRLPPLVRDLALDFTALSLVAPEKVRFRYRLEGQDMDWKEVAGERRVQYSNLPPGPYRFRVLACNNSGVWNEAGALLDFSIVPAFYQMLWFRFSCVALFLALLWAGYQLRIRQLQRQEKRLRAVIEGMPALAFSVYPDGSPEFLNPRWLDYVGLSAEAMADARCWEATIHPADVEAHLNKWRTALASGEPFESEARHRSASGEYRWFLARAVPFRDQQAQIVKWYGALTDIEDRKRADEALDRTHRQYEALVNSIDGIVWEADAETFQFNFVSEQAEKILGYPVKQWRGEPNFWANHLHPDDREQAVRLCVEATQRGEDHQFEYRMIAADGRAVWVRDMVAVHTTAEGKVWLRGILVDITERKRAEQRLLVQHIVTQILAEVTTLEEAMPKILQAVCECLDWDLGVLWRSDREAGVLRCVEVWRKESAAGAEFEASSRASTFETGATLSGRIWSSHEPIYIPDVVQAVDFSRVSNAARAGLHAAFGVPILLGSEVLGVIEFFSHEIRQPDQELLDLMAIIGSQIGQFIERKRAENALQHAQVELAHVTRVMTMGELTASIAHEVNQPLAAVITNGNASLRWLANQPPNFEEVRECLKRIIRDGNRASAVITRIRSLVKKSTPAQAKLDLNEAIREVLVLTQAEALRDQVLVWTELAEDLPVVRGDRVQLQQVILNLVMNGIEAMKGITNRSRELWIRSRSADFGQVLIAIQDTGSGLKAQNLEHLFEAFYTTKAEGMGMGLSISRSIIEAHGGRLWPTVNGNYGATFQFTLPTAVTAVTAVTAATAATDEGSNMYD
jgi:PAS domain S-box-containing protein